MKSTLLNWAMLIALFSSPLLNFAQAPVLGTAADFVIFSSNGAVNNTAMSQLTGNVGTNNGANTGFGNVNGVMHTSDLASATAAVDLLIAYNQLNAVVPTLFPAPLLGNGDTLEAGIYSISEGTSLNLNLTLDAEGIENAIFIFKIQGTLSTNALSQVILINGAKACNVFWKVEGLVSMESGTSMKGTIIANNAAIVMKSGVMLEGRALSTTGAVSVNSVLAYTPVGCGSPVLTGPTAPYLASAACYAIFSGNGSIANSGVSTVTGDIGTNVGLTTGFDPLLVTGTVHPGPDGSTSACATDLLTAYNYLNVLPVDIELLYPAQFGNNLVLTPHTYLLNAATALTDTLFLNADSVQDAVFVIKINGAFSTSTYATVVLLNGAQAKNVYWKVDGAVSINDYSVFKGTIIGNNGAINLTTGVNLEGRALTTNGAFSTAAVNVVIPDNGCVVLPVTWLYFRGKAIQNNAVLEWGTSSEKGNGFFTLEKSNDGVNFKKLATILAAKETGTDEHNYSFTDITPYPLSFYRISQTDLDGKVDTYKTIQVKMNNSVGFTASHYVQGNSIVIRTSGAVPGNATIQLFSLDGKKLASKKIVLTKEVSTYEIDKSMQNGIYLIYMESYGKKLYHGKVLVN